MTQPPAVLKDVPGEQPPSSGSVLKKRFSVRSYLWLIIKQSVTRGAMASWGLPFEAIAASMLLNDRNREKKPHNGKKNDRASGPVSGPKA